MKRYIRSTSLINVPSFFNIEGLEDLKDFVGTRGEIYDFIARRNPLAIIDKRQALVKIDGVSYLITLKKVDGGWVVTCIWQLVDKEHTVPGGQYYLQEDRFRAL